MLKAALVGALALATAGTMLPASTTVRADDFDSPQRHQAWGKPVLSESQIVRIKSALRLTREQERYWPAVASALRGLRRQATRDAAFVQRLADRATAMAVDALGLQRVVRAAMPLFESLDENQKVVARRIVDSMGYGSFAAAL